MKIGINARFLGKPLTGIGQVTSNFLREWARLHGIDARSQHGAPRVILYCQEPPRLDFELPADFEIRVFVPWWKRADRLREWLWERELANRAVADGCDVFLSLYQAATVFPREKRHVMLVHDLIPKLFPEYLARWSARLHYGAVLRGIRGASAIITPSEATKQDLIRLLGVSEVSIERIPLGVDPVFSQPLEPAALRAILERYALDPGYLYTGGGLEKRKNTQAVLEAYADLVKDEPHLPPLVISGELHAESNRLATPVRSLVQALGIAERVKLLGAVPQADLPALYQGAALFLFPSRYEGFGLPVLEAAASKTPVITTSAGALSELVSPETAIIVSDGEAARAELSAAIKRLLADAALRTHLTEAGARRAEEYRWEHFARTLASRLVQ